MRIAIIADALGLTLPEGTVAGAISRSTRDRWRWSWSSRQSSRSLRRHGLYGFRPVGRPSNAIATTRQL